MRELIFIWWFLKISCILIYLYYSLTNSEESTQAPYSSICSISPKMFRVLEIIVSLLVKRILSRVNLARHPARPSKWSLEKKFLQKKGKKEKKKGWFAINPSSFSPPSCTRVYVWNGAHEKFTFTICETGAVGKRMPRTRHAEHVFMLSRVSPHARN